MGSFLGRAESGVEAGVGEVGGRRQKRPRGSENCTGSKRLQESGVVRDGPHTAGAWRESKP